MRRFVMFLMAVVMVLNTAGTAGYAAALIPMADEACAASTKAAEKAEMMLRAASLSDEETFQQNMAGIWEGNTVYRESIWPVQEKDGSLADISLLYHIDQILSVQSADLSQTYVEGVDYTLVDGKLHILPTGAIPVTTYDFFFPASGSLFSTSDGRGLYFQEGPDIQNRQTVITYLHSDAYTGYVPTNKSAFLPKTMEKLRQGGNLQIVYYGDSITEGYNCSSYMNSEPYLPRWSELLTRSLQNAYPQADISAVNTGLAGQTSAWGVENVQARVMDYHPDLVVLAFGMNDGTQNLNAAGFVSNIQEIMTEVQAANPDVEFILLSTTLANPISTFVGTQCDYEPVLLSLEREGVAVAQMSSMHESLLTKKAYAHMTGNNINHPNDFLVRVYGQVLAALFTGNVIYDPSAENSEGNLALHKQAYATTQVAFPAFAAVNLTNGTTARSEKPGSLDYGYSSNGYGSRDLSAAPTVLTVDLEKAAMVNRVVLWPRTDVQTADGFACHFPTAFTVALSVDGATYTTVANIDDPDQKEMTPRVVDFEASEARYVRLTVTAVSAPSAGEVLSYAQLNEIQIFGEAKKPPTEEILLGDLDDDGKITVSDVVGLRQVIVSGGYVEREMQAGDLDADEQLTVSDVVALRRLIVEGSESSFADPTKTGKQSVG